MKIGLVTKTRLTEYVHVYIHLPNIAKESQRLSFKHRQYTSPLNQHILSINLR